jgi:hypothetical protein
MYENNFNFSIYTFVLLYFLAEIYPKLLSLIIFHKHQISTVNRSKLMKILVIKTFLAGLGCGSVIECLPVCVKPWVQYPALSPKKEKPTLSVILLKLKQEKKKCHRIYNF